MNKLEEFFTPARRRYIYRVANATLAVAVGYNLVEGNKVALFGLLLNAILGLADANVPNADDAREDGGV